MAIPGSNLGAAPNIRNQLFASLSWLGANNELDVIILRVRWCRSSLLKCIANRRLLQNRSLAQNSAVFAIC